MPISILAALVLTGGQSSVPSENRRHAIVGARIEIGDGRVIEKGNLIIENGRITAVGADVAIPAGCLTFAGAGLTVMPGFIDAWTSKGINLPPAQPDQDVAPSIAEYAPAAMREANRKGIRPELLARNLLSLTDDITKPYREAGFTSIMTAPAGGYLGGVGTFANLSGRPSRETILVPETALGANFDGGADSVNYPGSLLGRVAQVRQVLLDAQWQRKVAETYRNGGPSRPAVDAALEALKSALDGQVPVAFAANTPAEIDRSLSVAKEFGLHPWIVGGLQGYRRTEAIRTSGSPVVLSINFGEPPVAPDGEDPARTVERKRLYEEATQNPLALNAAGIKFVLSTQGTKDPADFLKQLRRAIAAGLPRDVAVRALTQGPAALYGLESRLGTLEVGKIANVVVRDGDFLLEKITVKMVYVDGYRLDPTAKPLPPGVKPAPVKDGERR